MSGELGGDEAGVDGVDGAEAEKLAASEKTEGVGDEATELVWEVTGDSTVGDAGWKGANWLGPGRRTLPLPESGDGRFGVEAVRNEGVDGVGFGGVVFVGIAFEGAGLDGVAIVGTGGGGLVGGGIAWKIFGGKGFGFDGVALNRVGCGLVVVVLMVVVMVDRVGGCSFGDVGGGIKAEGWWVGSGGCASSLWDSGEGFRSEAMARRTRGGSVFLLLKSGEGLLTMSELNWKGSGGLAGRDDPEGSELLLLGMELLLLKSGWGTRSVSEPKVNMGGPIMSTSGFSAGAVVSGFLYW